MTAPSTIGPHTRDDSLQRLASETFDVCIVGGGITGAGVALDAASRGMSVALVERGDFGSGTSSRSSNLIHGGLRYLGRGDIGLVRESLRERSLLRRSAPHLVRPLPFLYLLRGQRRAVDLRIGLTAYDLLAGPTGLGRHRSVNRDGLRHVAPRVRAQHISASWVFWEAVTDDARLVLEVLRAAHLQGAVIANHLRVRAFEMSGRRVGAIEATDTLGGASILIRASCFVNAAGVWAEDVALLEGREAPSLRPSKGVHLSVPSAVLPLELGCVFPASDHRDVFAYPDGPVVVIGTTDSEWHGSLDAPTVDLDDVAYLLDAVRATFDVDLGIHDVVGAWAGLRPLLDGANASTVDLSRRHHLSVSKAQLITITGGKLTTFRSIAEEAVDRVCDVLGRFAPSGTKRIRLGHPSPDEVRTAAGSARSAGLDGGCTRWLLSVHGARATEVIALVLEDPSLGRPLVPGLRPIAAEAIWAARHEMAFRLDDVLVRRLRLARQDASAGLSSPASRLVAETQGWSAEEAAEEVRRYHGSVAAERGAISIRTNRGGPLARSERFEPGASVPSPAP